MNASTIVKCISDPPHTTSPHDECILVNDRGPLETPPVRHKRIKLVPGGRLTVNDLPTRRLPTSEYQTVRINVTRWDGRRLSETGAHPENVFPRTKVTAVTSAGAGTGCVQPGPRAGIQREDPRVLVLHTTKMAVRDDEQAQTVHSD